MSAPYAGHWDEQEGYPVIDWKAAVAADETRLGYMTWVKQRSEMEQ